MRGVWGAGTQCCVAGEVKCDDVRQAWQHTPAPMKSVLNSGFSGLLLPPPTACMPHGMLGGMLRGMLGFPFTSIHSAGKHRLKLSVTVCAWSTGKLCLLPALNAHDFAHMMPF